MPSLKMLATVAFSAASIVGSEADAMPDFVGKPSAVYDGYVAINGPRADVPVGALWIDGFGPHGAPASADNLETVRGLTGITISKDLQLQLTAGLLSFLGIAPGLQKHFVARFADLSIVRVKDVSRLEGPSSELRIIEAMKAGSVSITSDSALSLDLDKRSFDTSFTTKLDSGRKGSFVIEGRDMFVAFRVASLEESLSKPVLIDLDRVGHSLEVDDAELAVDHISCTTSDCKTDIKWLPVQKGLVPDAAALRADRRQPLPVPIADGRGGLYTDAQLEVIAPCSVAKSEDCGHKERLRARLVGTRITDLSHPSAKGW